MQCFCEGIQDCAPAGAEAYAGRFAAPAADAVVSKNQGAGPGFGKREPERGRGTEDLKGQAAVAHVCVYAQGRHTAAVWKPSHL